MHNMLIRPTPEELAAFGKPDAVIFNAGAFPANQRTTGMTSKTSIDVNLQTREMVILGTEYAGEMKKGVFTMMNYFGPKQGVLSMHCSATADPATGSSSLLFGLSGTGKTTLSADPKRQLIGDDEHCWSDTGIFNIEGGCYAKAIDLTAESEPDIFQALRFGAVLENVVFDPATHRVDFRDTSITQNTRGAYPIEFIRNAQHPVHRGTPHRCHLPHLRRLRCVAAGEPAQPGAGDVPLHQRLHRESRRHRNGDHRAASDLFAVLRRPIPAVASDEVRRTARRQDAEARARVWLVNTGWSGGAYGTGKRMKLGLTRAIVDAIHSGKLADAPTTPDPVFGVGTVTSCAGVPGEVLVPRDAWGDKSAYDATARKLAGLFVKNFQQYESLASADVKQAGPRA